MAHLLRSVRSLSLLGTTIAVAASLAAANLARAQDHVDLVKLPRPPFPAAAKAPVVGTNLRLKQVSARANNITDVDEWFAKNNLPRPGVYVDHPQSAHGELPEEVPPQFYDHMLIKVIRDGKWLLLLYGEDFHGARYVAGWDTARKEMAWAFDFANYVLPPRYVAADREFISQPVEWAAVAGDTLYVSNFHQTYAKSSHGLNGYLTAVDLKTRKVRWRTQPRVVNTDNFIIRGNAIITGYGFTAEPDYLYVLDRKTGGIQQEVKLKSAAEWIVPKGNRLHVRAYNTDYVFTLVKP